MAAASDRWGIPRLDPSTAATREDLPAEWFAWGSGAARPGTASGRGVHFYVTDRLFSAVYRRCDTPVTFGAPAIVEPNYSTYEGYPKALALGDIYRKRWLARYWGEKGLKVLVDVNVADGFEDIMLLGVPKGWKAYATRMHKGRTILDLVNTYFACVAHARDWRIAFAVCGGGEAVRDLAAKHRWAWIPEQQRLAHGGY